MTAAGTVPVTVTVTPPLLEALEPSGDVVRRGVEAELANLAADLGVDARPRVRLEAGDGGDAKRLMRVRVSGVTCPFFRPVLAEAVAYVDGTSRIEIDVEAVRERLLSLAASDAERVAEALGLVVREAVSGQPGILLGTRAGLAHAALELGMSIAGGEGTDQLPVEEDGDPAELLVAALAEPTIDVLVEPEYLQLLTREDPRAERFPFLRDGLFVELGLPLPPFHFRPDPSLRPRGFAFRVNAIRTLPRIGLASDAILINDAPDRLPDIDSEETVNPASYQPGALVARQHKGALEERGLTTWDAFEFLILSFAAAIRRRAHALMTRDGATGAVQQLAYVFPALGEAATTHAPPDVLAPVLRELLLDGVPIRNLRRILELLIRRATDDDAGRASRIAFVRAGLADLIANAAARQTDTIVAYLLSHEIEDALAEWDETSDGDGDALAERVRAAVRAEIDQLPRLAAVPAVLTRDDVRRKLRDVLRLEFPLMRILGYGDLPPTRNIQPVARISWA